MKEYIEKEAAIKIRVKGGYNVDGLLYVPWRDVMDYLRAISPADVKPVVRGKWKWNDDNGYYYCSKCGAISPREDQNGEYIDCPNFCPNCGADMRKEDTHED